ncbi:MAG: hypothetical protein J6B26_01535 [Agathobacter sp.]|nr:hypothetical protein [Agathobacter sp.]MBP3568135.1 hypothetical protein [Lachnospiraceae bacterium]
MKQIMSQFGGVILAGVVMVLLFIIFMNVEVDGKKGIFEITGAMSAVEGADYSQNKDQETLVINAVRKKPTLSFSSEAGAVKRGSVCSILGNLMVTLPDDADTYFLSEAEEDGFTKFSYQIIKIKSPSGADVTDLYDVTSKSIIFPATGSYTFEIVIKDSEQKESRLFIQVPVDS